MRTQDLFDVINFGTQKKLLFDFDSFDVKSKRKGRNC